jgi:tetrahydrodipicolinate N-succinyltransferase
LKYFVFPSLRKKWAPRNRQGPRRLRAPYSVVVSGSLPGKSLPDGLPGPSLYCAVIVKTVDAQTRAKTGINELLRE